MPYVYNPNVLPSAPITPPVLQTKVKIQYTKPLAKKAYAVRYTLSSKNLFDPAKEEAKSLLIVYGS